MSVPFFDFRQAPSSLKSEWLAALDAVIQEGVFVGGPIVKEFEDLWSSFYCEGRPVVGVGNGLDAITIGLRALGIGPGDLVAVPAHTFIATWLAVVAVGATPIGVDVGADGQLNVEKLISLSPRPRAVIPVHMHGLTVDMPRLMSWAAVHEVLVLEDCSQAHGASVAGRPVGTWGDIAAFSFYPTKNLGAIGDAGAIVIRDSDTAIRTREIANYGTRHGNKYEHVTIGVNSRLDPLQAAILMVNAEHLAQWSTRRKEIASRYVTALSSINALKLLCEEPDSSVWHHFVVMVKNRDKFRTELAKKGIMTEMHYPRSAASEMRSFRISHHSWANDDFAQAQEISEMTVSLPMSPWLSDEQIEQVIEAVGVVCRREDDVSAA